MKLSTDEIEHIKAFEKISGAEVKDCIIHDDEIVYLVKKGDMGLAIGKNGKCVKKAKRKFDKKISLIEHSKDPKEFIKNVFDPVPIESMKIKSKTVEIHTEKRKKNRLIGRKGKRIKRAKKLLKRHHNIEDIKLK